MHLFLPPSTNLLYSITALRWIQIFISIPGCCCCCCCGVAASVQHSKQKICHTNAQTHTRTHKQANRKMDRNLEKNVYSVISLSLMLLYSKYCLQLSVSNVLIFLALKKILKFAVFRVIWFWLYRRTWLKQTLGNQQKTFVINLKRYNREYLCRKLSFGAYIFTLFCLL